MILSDQDGVKELDVVVTEYRNNGGGERQADAIGSEGLNLDAFDLVRAEAGWVSTKMRFSLLMLVRFKADRFLFFSPVSCVRWSCSSTVILLAVSSV